MNSLPGDANIKKVEGIRDLLESIVIRREQTGDEGGVRRVNLDAFGQSIEADLVDALRAAGKVVLSLVALEGEAIMGHILFSPATVATGGRSWRALGLAPMAVAPELQRRGIGGMLIRQALGDLAEMGHERVIVLGHAAYYRRFGFVAASRYGVRWEHEVPDDVFMALELHPGAFDGVSGVARFQPEFGMFSEECG